MEQLRQALAADPVGVIASIAAAVFALAILILLPILLLRRRPQPEIDKLSTTLRELMGARDADRRALEARLDSLGGRVAETGAALSQRLAAVDRAQANIEKLSGDVLGLQDILTNNPARGAFGEIQLNDLVGSALPPNAYDFQVTLSNGARVDALIKLPNPPGAVPVDAKYPLDAYRRLIEAEEEAGAQKGGGGVSRVAAPAR